MPDHPTPELECEQLLRANERLVAAREVAKSPEQRELLGTERASLHELPHHVSEMLDFSKIEACQLAIARERCFVADVAEGVAASMSVHAFQKGLRLTVDIDQRIPTMTVGDGPRLRTVLTNLVSNAIKFTREGGVAVSAALAARGARSVDVHFTVSDTGVGIPAEALDRVFDRFYQVDASTRRAHGGSGLGLNTCRSLAELMGGSIRVESELGAGTTFHVVLPFGITHEPPPNRRLSDAGVPGHTAVIVSPEAGIRAGIANVMRSLKCDVHVADETAGGHRDIWPRATIVVLDAALGLTSVKELAEVFRLGTGDRPPVIFIAADATEAERRIAEALPAARVLPKPVARRRAAIVVAEGLGSPRPTTRATSR